ncbi:MAG: NTP transferase domain-containing protein [Desulfobulbaceae bacterium]|nr:NTP transferase domain-containing protein [Desulfobulbaceae bacterium]
MSCFKPLAPLGDSTVLEQVLNTLRSAGVGQVLVVSGHRSEDLAPVVASAGGRLVFNSHHLDGMFTSVQAGVNALDQKCPGFFLLPADIPLIRVSTLRRMSREFTRENIDLVHPVFLGRRGHPPIISLRLLPWIMQSDGRGGLRHVLGRFEQARPDSVMPLPVADSGIIRDMDTEEDYRKVYQRFAARGLPNAEECQALLDLADTPERVRWHGRAVARVAVALGLAVNQGIAPGDILDLERIERAALLHDLAKGLPMHEQKGGHMLEEAGFTDIAGIVASHRDLDPEPGSSISEREVVFLADKMVIGTELVPLEKRYNLTSERYGADPEARKAIAERRQRAYKVAARVEAAMGRTLADVAAKVSE